MQLKATILTKDAEKVTTSIQSGDRQITMYWPLSMIPQTFDIGDNFYIKISGKPDMREEFTNGNTKSLDELRELLYELIN
ncbi:MAG: hypothetical protein UV80_C0013G0016 [Candidatus Peregrinibacteria bacterium GW2011_GWF2_43_17]|nr:MAG: hypothetical protein UV80_C0013G0016 [Candidatus Peregrinibacteria bacterium GW2011_GWF2_43_17]